MPTHGNWSGQELYEKFHIQKSHGGKINWKGAKKITGMGITKMRGRYRRYEDKVKDAVPKAPPEEKPKFVSEGNFGELSYTIKKGLEDEVVVHPDQLAALAGVDLDVWELSDKFELRTWGQHSNEFGYKTLWYVRAPYRRKVLLPTEWEPVAPVRFPDFRTNSGTHPFVAGDAKLTIVLPDLQIGYRRNVFTGRYEPYHDRKAIGLALQLVQDLDPNQIIIGGDILDAPEASTRFTPEPEHRFTFQAAVIEAGFILASLRKAAPHATIIALEGNHDKRVADQVTKVNQWAYGLHKAGELEGYPVLSIPYLLDMEALNIQWVGNYPDSRYRISRGLFAEHGAAVRAKPGDTAKALANKWLDSYIFCHIHRREVVSRTVWVDGIRHEVTAASPGTLSKTDGSVPGATDRRNWQQGLAIVTSHKEMNQIDVIEIKDGAMLVGPTHYHGAKFLDGDLSAILEQALDEGLSRIAKFR